MEKHKLIFFNFVLKVFKHSNGLVDVGGIFLCSAPIPRVSLCIWQSLGNDLRHPWSTQNLGAAGCGNNCSSVQVAPNFGASPCKEA